MGIPADQDRCPECGLQVNRSLLMFAGEDLFWSRLPEVMGVMPAVIAAVVLHLVGHGLFPARYALVMTLPPDAGWTIVSVLDSMISLPILVAGVMWLFPAVISGAFDFGHTAILTRTPAAIDARVSLLVWCCAAVKLGLLLLTGLLSLVG